MAQSIPDQRDAIRNRPDLIWKPMDSIGPQGPLPASPPLRLSAVHSRLCVKSPRAAAHQTCDPDLIPPDLAAEPVDRLAADGRATAVGEPEPPAVERADGLALLDPARAPAAHWRGGSGREGDDRAAVAEDRQATARPRSRYPTPLGDISSSRQTATHSAMTQAPPASGGNRNTKSLGLASEACHHVQFTGSHVRPKAAVRHRGNFVRRQSGMRSKAKAIFGLAVSWVVAAPRGRLRPQVGGRRPSWSGASTGPSRAGCTSRGSRRSTRSDQLYLADLTDRIQVFDRDGQLPAGLADARFQRRWAERADDRPPRAGCWWPTRISTGSWSTRAKGELLFQIGDGVQGTDPGPVRLSDRRRDRPRGEFLRRGVRRERPHPGVLARGEVAPPVGGHGYEPGEFLRPAGPGHRRARPALRGRQLQPSDPGLRHPGQAAADLGDARDGAGRDVVSLRPGDRAGRIACTSASTATTGSRSSRSTASRWGSGARRAAGPGELYNPWALAVDGRGDGLGDRLEQPSRPAVPALRSRARTARAEGGEDRAMLRQPLDHGRGAPGG